MRGRRLIRRAPIRRQLALTAGPSCKARPAVAVSAVASAHHQGRFPLDDKARRPGGKSGWLTGVRHKALVLAAATEQAAAM